MIPKRVVLKNFLSFGDEEQTFDFTDADESLWILTGPNGVGKSAVFDAITYCLFGQHRGGKDGAGSLIRHGSNGFRLVFEFEFSAADYRITRTRGSTTTQRIEQKDAKGEWKAIPGVNSVTEVGAWIEKTLGLRFEAFTASVLLRQGQADAIVEATGKERLGLLKRIIDVERFEHLSSRIGEAAKKCRGKLLDLQERRGGTKEVTEDDVAAAKTILDESELSRASAHDAKLAAAQRVAQAKQYARLTAEWADLDRQLKDADERARQREAIERAHGRLVELQAVVPPLRKILTARTRMADFEKQQDEGKSSLEKLREELDATTAAWNQTREKAVLHTHAKANLENEAKRLGDEIEREAKFLSTAEQVAELSKTLNRFTPDLDARLNGAREALHAADEAAAAASTAKTEAKTKLEQFKLQQTEFETVGATCSRCRQPVDAKHAAEERQKFAREIADLTEQVAAADLALKTVKHKRVNVNAEAESLADDVRTRDNAQTARTIQKTTLDNFGIQADPIELQRRLEANRAAVKQKQADAKQEATLAAAATSEATNLEASANSLSKRRNTTEANVRTVELNLAVHGKERDTITASLAAEWQVRAAAITDWELEELAAEYNRLDSSGAASAFFALQNDSKSQIAWIARRENVKREVEELPTGSVAEAEAAVAEANDAAREADRARDAAKTEHDRLAREAEAFQTLRADIAIAELAHERHRKLNDWLGKDGLLRELVREAERDIVRFAQDTLRNLSGGDLEVELQAESDGRDEALVLHVRRANDPVAIPVKFLSGSQKFRVAVAIAVAIGKFAAGPSSARPLESVIIDEGFGSLDKDGLHAMRDELENLKTSQALKRVILVSHQEEFTSTFPVGYRLAPGENGTVAKRFRHSGADS